jgi:hypothetical protein
MLLKIPNVFSCLPLTQESDTTISEPSLNPRLSRPKSRPREFDRFSRDLSKHLYILMHCFFIQHKIVKVKCFYVQHEILHALIKRHEECFFFKMRWEMKMSRY